MSQKSTLKQIERNNYHGDQYFLRIFFTAPGLERKCHYWASATADLAVLAKLGENSAGGQVSCPSSEELEGVLRQPVLGSCY